MLGTRLRQASSGALLPAELGWIGIGFDDSATATSFDFGDFNMPAGGLAIVAVVHNRGGGQNVDGVTIGGGAATVDAFQESSVWAMAIASRLVPAGASNVSVSISGTGGFNVAVGVWLLQRPALAAVHDSAATGSGSGSSTPTVDVPANGFVIYAASQNAADIGWSAATERAEIETDSSPTRYVSFADRSIVPGASGEVETVSSNTWAIAASYG